MQHRFGDGSEAFYGGGGGVGGDGGVDQSLPGVMEIVIGNLTGFETRTTVQRSTLRFRGHGWDGESGGRSLNSWNDVPLQRVLGVFAVPQAPRSERR